MRYIVEHYDSLPDVCIFIKGNMFQRPEERGGAEYYTTHERFYRALTAEYFLPIERFHETTAIFINGGGFVQPTWEALTNQTIYTRHFATFPQMMSKLFVNPPNFPYNRFAPGGNYVVPKQISLNLVRSFMKNFNSMFHMNHPKSFKAPLVKRT